MKTENVADSVWDIGTSIEINYRGENSNIVNFISQLEDIDIEEFKNVRGRILKGSSDVFQEHKRGVWCCVVDHEDNKL